MKYLTVLCFLCLAAVTVGVNAAFGQAVNVSNGSSASGALSEGEIALMRRDLRSEKKKLIAMNLSLTDEEATRFWPVYDRYVGDITKLHDGFYATIRDYSDNNKTWTDAEFTAMLDRWVKFQVEEAKTRQKFIPLIQKAIPPRKAALFLQIDRRLYALLDLQVSAFLPLTTQ